VNGHKTIFQVKEVTDTDLMVQKSHFQEKWTELVFVVSPRYTNCLRSIAVNDGQNRLLNNTIKKHFMCDK